MNRTVVAKILLILSILPCRAIAAVNGDIVSIGFPYRSGDIVIGGAWTTVVVDLNLEAGTESFDGSLRVEQRDRDGDRGFDEVEVHLRRDTGGYQRYWLYVPANPRQEYRGEAEFGGFRITLRTMEGELADFRTGGVPVRYLEPSQTPEVIPQNDFIVLSISHRMGKLGIIETATDKGALDRFARVAHIGPGMVPDLWQGLEAADAVIWDEVDPSEIDQKQRDAIIEWTRNGGTLILAAGETINALVNYWGDELPVTTENSFEAVLTPDFTKDLLSVDQEKNVYIPAISILESAVKANDPTCRVLLKEGSIPYESAAKVPVNDILNLIDLQDSSVDALRRHTDLITEKKIGRGKIIFIAATISDLLRNDPEPYRFYKQILQLRREDRSNPSVASFGNVFSYLERQIGFERTAAAYLVLAVGFAIAYVAIATFGCWAVMRRRDWRRHNWTAFTVVAAAACVLSLVGVQSVRGVTRQVHQLSVLDGWANSSEVSAHCYLGLKTPTFSSIDLWLKGAESNEVKPGPTTTYVKPLPPGELGMSDGTAFVDPARYRLRPNSAVLENVPIRATVKQLEGRWSGYIPGRIFANLVLHEWGDSVGDWRFDNTSFIQNDLGVDLYGCVLIQPYNWRDPLREHIDRAKDFRVFEIGDVPAGERLTLVDHLYLDPFGQPRERNKLDDKNLRSFQLNWWKGVRPRAIGFGSTEEAAVSKLSFTDLQNVLMLATTADDFYADSGGQYLQATRMSFHGIRSLSMSDVLDYKTALFVGFADQPGPVRLCTGSNGDFDTIEPTKGHAKVMYRFLVPMNYPRLENNNR